MTADNAAEEPILIKERRTAIARETMTEFKGIFHPGLTYSTSHYSGVPSDSIMAFTYMTEKFAEWDAVITGKRPQLARGSGHFRNGASC